MILVSPNFFKRLVKKGYVGIAIWPFIIFADKKFKKDPIMINHEKIHLRQQIEFLIIPFYVWYILEFLYYLIKLKNHQAAYRNISFEKEAYGMEADLQYLKTRKFWAFRKFLSK